MDATASDSLPHTGGFQRLLRRFLAIGENRFQLLMVEVEEGRDHILSMVFHALAAAVLGLLCGIAWSAALVFALWPINPALTLLGLGTLYGIVAIVLYRRLIGSRPHHPLEATIEQLRKDRACLEGF